MTSRLNPYISFKDNARQALEFYRVSSAAPWQSSTFGEMGIPDAPEADNVMHGMLETDSGYTLMAADTPPGMEHNPGTNMAVSLSGDDARAAARLLGQAVQRRQRVGPAREADVG